MVRLGKGKALVILLIAAFIVYVFLMRGAEVRPGANWLVIAQAEDADTLDPVQTVYDMATRITSVIYDTLMTFDWDMNRIPMLAENWYYNEAGMFYEFKLRNDVRFHCGHSFTGEAVEYTINRIKTHPRSKHRESVEHILDVEVDRVDDYTVRVYLTKDDRYLLDWFGTVSSVIVCPHCAEEYDFGPGHDYDFGTPEGPPCGTGPFKFKDWIAGDKIELERYEDYNWGPEIYNNKGPAHLDGIVFKVIREDMPREVRFERGEVDFVTSVRVSRDLFERWRENPGIELYIEPGCSSVYLGFNCAGAENTHSSSTEFHDIELSPRTVPKKVRQAIAYAINEDEIIDVALMGAASRTYSWLVEGIWSSAGYQENMYPYNPDEARRLLAEAGYGDGLELEVMYSGDPKYGRVAAELNRQLEEVGITLSIQDIPFTALEARIADKDYDMFIMGYTWHNADMIWWEFHTVRLPSPNRFWWGDEYTDAIIDNTWSMDDDVALKALRDGQRLIAEDAASIGLYARPVMMARRTYVKDFRLHPLAGGCWDFLDAYIVKEPHAVWMTVTPSENSGPPGSELYYTVIVTNVGTEDDNYTLEVSDNAGWTLALSDDLLEVPSGENKTTTLSVTIPGDAVPCTRDKITVVATSRTENIVADNASCIAHMVAS